eukprot:s1_g2205.t1
MAFETIDLVFRYGAVTALLVFAILLLRGHRDSWPGRLGIATAVCTAAYLICSVSDNYWVELILMPACIANAALVWMFGLSLFQDRFRPEPWHWGVLAFLLVRGYWNMLLGPLGVPHLPAYLNGAHQIVLVGMGLHLAWVAWRGRADDLIEDRRRFRLLFIAFLATMMLVVGAYELQIGDGPPAFELQLLQALVIWFVAVALLVRAATLSPDALFFPSVEDLGHEESEAGRPSAAEQTSVRDLEALQVWIGRREGLFTPSLTIGMLADQVKIPEHRLRRLINTELKFRNFNDFLNQYRIEEAKQRLRDAELARLPILTIAMDLGYGSIGPFNRAFKERQGMTPSAYRLGTEAGAPHDAA